MAEIEREPGAKIAPVVIKKYANRRLYNTATSSYVTLDHLCQMVKEQTDFVVYDAKTGEDITRPVLTQIIVEEESKGQNLLPISFLRQLIAFYGDSLQGVVPQYLEFSMKSFAHNQERMRDYMKTTFGFNPFAQFAEVGKQNVAMFEKAMKMFTPPFTPGMPGMPGIPGMAGATAETATADKGDGDKAQIDELKRKLDELQGRLDDIKKS